MSSFPPLPKGDRRISQKHDPKNRFSWNWVEVYASRRLLEDVARVMKATDPNNPFTPGEWVHILYCEYATGPGVFEAYSLVFNGGKPYRIAYCITQPDTATPRDMTEEERRAYCRYRVRLDLPDDNPKQ